MSPERFQEICRLFDAALTAAEQDRAAFLRQACGDDRDLEKQVSRLLEVHDATVTLDPAETPSLPGDRSSPVGKRLGDYELLRLLGRGGMGNVYLARRFDEAFKKNVAVKILRADVASGDIVRRFQMEREILAELDHPSIARLLDAGQTEDGLPYFVMEYVAGKPVTEYADGERLSIEDRIMLFRQVCDAVEYAHRRNVIHRDLKPSNVFVTTEGQVKLLDFGIARLANAAQGGRTVTVSGAWLMTPEYASPEQVRGESVGRESDVYSLGVIRGIL